ncbi:MAG: DNA methylase [Flavobacteriales bacterium]|nr:MAG: DNA methylase [Flavobacteriales bacterium]
MLKGLEISILNLSEVKDNNETQRIDSEYFKEEYLDKIRELKSTKHQQLFELSSIKGGKRLPLGEEFSLEGIPYIRAQDVKNNFIGFENSPRISEKLHLKLINYQTKRNDVLITNVGNSIGDTGIVKFNIEKCNLTENAVKIISKKINPDYLFSFFQSKFGKFQIERETVGTAQPKLAIERIRKFIIPTVNNKFQDKISSIIKKSYLNKNQAKQSYNQAETLLLQEIGLQDFTPSKEPVNIKSFADSFAASGRLDAEYYQKKYEDVVNTVKNKPFDVLSNLVEIKKSIEPGSKNYVEEGLPFMRVADLSKNGLSEPQKYISSHFVKENQNKVNDLKPKKGTILFSKDGSVGIAYHLRQDYNGITSGAILHLNVKDESSVIPEYLTLALNSKIVQMQAERDAGGSIILHWRSSEIENVVVPIIDYKKQQQIAELIEQSFTLKKQSAHLLEVAKRAVEIAIEEDEKVALVFIKKETESLPS